MNAQRIRQRQREYVVSQPSVSTRAVPSVNRRQEWNIDADEHNRLVLRHDSLPVYQDKDLDRDLDDYVGDKALVYNKIESEYLMSPGSKQNVIRKEIDPETGNVYLEVESI